MQEDWDFYHLKVDDGPAAIFVNLGLRQQAPVEDFQWLGYVRVVMREPRPDGLCSSSEFNALSSLEDDICPRITMTGDIIYVGRNTSEGNRDFFFYCNDEDQFLKAANAALRRFPEYRYEVGTKPDPEWRAYLNFLYPSPRSMQTIQNRRVREALKKHGDDMTVPRDVDHRVYFTDGRMARQFGDWLVGLGFAIVALERLDEQSRFFVDFVRRDRPDDIDAIILQLYDKVVELGGDYDGWGCEAQSDKPD